MIVELREVPPAMRLARHLSEHRGGAGNAAECGDGPPQSSGPAGTGAASSAPLPNGPIPAWMIGCSIPNNSQIDVLIIAFLLAR
jgi:hypothetical protein